MQVLLTGATGFLGRHVVSALGDAGHAVRAVIRPGANLGALHWGSDIDLYYADLCGSEDLVAAFESVDVLIHLAACLQGSDQERLTVTVQGTQRLLEAMARSSTKRLVVASSLAVYDLDHAGHELTESSTLASDDLERRDAYTVAKIRQENLTRRYSDSHGWQVTVLRPGPIWGEGRLFIHQIGRRLGPLLFVVAPSAPLRGTYVENCALAFVATVEHEAAGSRTFNVVDGHGITRWQYAGEYLRSIDRRVLRVPVPFRPAVCLAWLADASAQRLSRGRYRLPGVLVPGRFESHFKPVSCSSDSLRRVLGWRPRFGFEEALERVLNADASKGSVPGRPKSTVRS